MNKTKQTMNKAEIKINIATARSRNATVWENKETTWAAFVERCAKVKRTPETLKQYRAMNKDDQGRTKDVGGFVGAVLKNGRRKVEAVQRRTLITLDIDYGTADMWDAITEALPGLALLMYSTHSHTEQSPRYRLILPLAHDIPPEQYEPIARRIAESVGIDCFDHTTYQTSRLFYWASAAQDAPFVFQEQEGEPLNPEKILATYTDPMDCASYPRGERETAEIRQKADKAEDPTQKRGIIGAFCREYSIEEAIETFLTAQYIPTTTPGRYTYTEGHTAGGLVCFDHLFAYSFHETDPAGGKLCNAFDLVRLHKFGKMDKNGKEDTSTAEMRAFASKDQRTRQRVTEEKRTETAQDFGDIDAEEKPTPGLIEPLELTDKGQVKSNIKNIKIILHSEPFAGKLSHNLFKEQDMIKGDLPWRKNPDRWTDRDDAELRCYMEEVWGITGRDKIRDARISVTMEKAFHPVRDYLNNLPKWGGVPRLDRLVIDYIGADDIPLYRAMTRKHFTAAVTRIYKPGTKYDYCLILAGAEGVGKSTLFAVMGGEWFNDSIVTLEGKQGMEQLVGTWIAELAELSSIKRSEVERVKGFISSQADNYRGAYQANNESRPRQCVFGGTTNEDYFLKGDTGNRRFWVIDIDPTKRKYKEYRKQLEADRDQLWAEALHYMRAGEPLYLPEELETQARKKQSEHNDDINAGWVAALEMFLTQKLPTDWAGYTLDQRRAFWGSGEDRKYKAQMQRTRFCAAEFLQEYMRISPTDSNYGHLTRKVNRRMREHYKWEEVQRSRHIENLYGSQRSFVSVPQEEDKE